MPYNHGLMWYLFRFESFYSIEILMNILNIQIRYPCTIISHVIPIMIYQNSLHIKTNIKLVFFHTFASELRLQNNSTPPNTSHNHIWIINLIKFSLIFYLSFAPKTVFSIFCKINYLFWACLHKVYNKYDCNLGILKDWLL